MKVFIEKVKVVNPVVRQCNRSGYQSPSLMCTIYIDLQLLELFELELITRLSAARLDNTNG